MSLKAATDEPPSRNSGSRRAPRPAPRCCSSASASALADGREFDIAVDPLECTRRCAHGQPVILYDETLCGTAANGRPFPALLEALGMIAGIKVDTGAKPLAQRVLLDGIVLKPNMVLSGYGCPAQASVEEVGKRTLRAWAGAEANVAAAQRVFAQRLRCTAAARGGRYAPELELAAA